jgi:hypothetical protein
MFHTDQAIANNVKKSASVWIQISLHNDQWQ